MCIFLYLEMVRRAGIFGVICKGPEVESMWILTFANLPVGWPHPHNQDRRCGWVKSIAPILAAIVLLASGCGVEPAKTNPAAEEPRHPSNEMDPPKEPAKTENRELKKRVEAKAAAKPARRVPAYEDPRRIPAGIEYGEMVRRFGPPTMRVTDDPSLTTFSYSKQKTQVQVEVQNGKVVSVASINTGF